MASSLGGYTASTHRHRPHAGLDKTQLEHARINGQLTRANSGLAAGVSAGTGVLHEGVAAAPLDDDDNRLTRHPKGSAVGALRSIAYAFQTTASLSSRRRRLLALASLALLTATLVVVAAVLTSVARALAAGRIGHGGLLASVVAAAFAAYVAWNEGWRTPALRSQAAELRLQTRRLVDARRQAGLHRLEAEVFRRRRGDWPQPPHSGALAALASATGATRGKFAALSAAPRAARREVDYRRFALACAARIVDDAAAASLGRISGADGAGAATDVQKRLAWLFQQLSLAGPRPDADPELYHCLHQTMDSMDTPAHGGSIGGIPESSPLLDVSLPRAGSSGNFGGGSATTTPRGFYCRLCLGWQKDASRGTFLECGHPLCPSCVCSLVDAVAGGSVAAPVACPAGCDACLSPNLARSAYFGVPHANGSSSSANATKTGAERAPATLAPVALVSSPSPRVVEMWERFERMHDVRTTLGQSAPHSRGLGSELAKAQKALKSAAS
ncbi:RING-type domain-containing protein [Pycnococcus provasolii]